MTEPTLAKIHARLRDVLAAVGAHIDAIYYCPHLAGTCTCRKPEPGMLEAAAERFGVTPSQTVMVGDADSDVEAGRRFGARTIRLTSRGTPGADTAVDLAAAADLILAR